MRPPPHVELRSLAVLQQAFCRTQPGVYLRAEGLPVMHPSISAFGGPGLVRPRSFRLCNQAAQNDHWDTGPSLP